MTPPQPPEDPSRPERGSQPAPSTSHQPTTRQPASSPRRRADPAEDRALDRLADRNPSTVGVDGARRARDVSRPTAEDLAEAERTVVVRRARKLDR